MKGKNPEAQTPLATKGRVIAPLLSFIAGEHAEAIDTLWHAPHADFFTLPTARRHAAAILLSGLAGRTGLTSAHLAHFISRQKDRAVAELIIGPAHSAGFMKMLGKCGETLWTRQRYADLLDLFRAEGSNLVLRHMDEVSETTLAPLSVLPAALRCPRIVSFLPHLSAGYDLAMAYDIVGRIGGEAAQKASADRWARASTRMSLFGLAASDLIPKEAATYRPPPVLPADFEQVVSTDQLNRVALQFKNCLADYAWALVRGRMAVYVWADEAPVALALIWGVDGWRLAEAELADNKELSEDRLRVLVDQLVPFGVRIGPATETLHNRLKNISHQTEVRAYPEDHEIKSFAEICDLGDLWQ